MNLVYFAQNHFDDIKQREQHLAAQFVRFGKVVYVEYSYSFLHLTDPPKQAAGRPSLREISPDFYVYAPPPLIPLSHISRTIIRLNCKKIARHVKNLLNELGIDDFIIGIGRTIMPDILDYFPGRRSYYDCMDEISEFPGINIPLVTSLEKQMMQKTCCVFVTAGRLKKLKAQYNKNIKVINNAVDFDFFTEDGTLSKIPEDLEKLSNPIIGYYGMVDKWFDVESVRAAAEKLNDFNFVIIGPIRCKDVKRMLNELPNVMFLGRKPYEQLPSYLKIFDVCLIPFILNELTHNVNPTKVYEYFSQGKPVIVSAMDEMKTFKDLIEVYHSPEELVQLIASAIKTKMTDIRRKRLVDFAKENSWSKRADIMHEYLNIMR